MKKRIRKSLHKAFLGTFYETNKGDWVETGYINRIESRHKKNLFCFLLLICEKSYIFVGEKLKKGKGSPKFRQN